MLTASNIRPIHLANCLLVLGLAIRLTGAQSALCTSQTTCGACIRTSNCVWCSQPDDGVSATNSFRCQPKSSANTCPAEFIVDPLPEFQVIEDNMSLGLRDIRIGTQLRPQRVSLKNLRLGHSYNISVRYTPARNYPLDLYFLMDLSHSMNDDKKNVEALGRTLADAMSNITSNFKLGFGSFVDKNVVPFVSTTGESCFNDTGTWSCKVTYSFKHRMSMNNDPEYFVSEVRNASIVHTRDFPDGGLDGLLQAIVCRQIGWSDRSRRLIVFVTDAPSHIAGDGRVGGVVPPNDGKCHLDNFGDYTEALNQDYPSLGQLGRVVRDNSINLVFAVTSNVKESYEMFSQKIRGSSVGILEGNSSNVVELIREQYKTISSSVQLKASSSSAVGVRFFTSCTGSSIQESDKCQGLVDEQTVSFTVNVEVKECPAEGDRKQLVTIYPIGVNESLTVELEIVCDCPCERPGNPGFEKNSTYCNSGGDYKCGVCDCDEQHSGRRCECSGDVDYSQLESQCKNRPKVLCSGRGSCVCGKCECETRPNPSEVISGEFCECDNFSCPRSGGKICAGNGECTCGECHCNEGWIGEVCDCKSSSDSCLPKGGEEYCSGNGICECGLCKCNVGATGLFCEDCPSCPDRCQEFAPCVKCRGFTNGTFNEINPCPENCTYPITGVEELQISATHERKCSYEVDNGCRFHFIYGFATDGEKRVRVQNTLDCPAEVPIMAIGIGLGLAFILAGLVVILAYRCYTYWHDRREYARFEVEKNLARWNAEKSPLYIDPNQLTYNPMFGAQLSN